MMTRAAVAAAYRAMADTYAEWSALLAQARLGVAPAELHGSVSGFLCAGWSGRAPELLEWLALPGAGDGAEVEALLDRAAVRISGRLRARRPAEILLPDGSLGARADAAVDWCRGFLGGLGLTGIVAECADEPPFRELLDALGRIAAAHLDCADGDDAMLDEVLDFMRRGVARLHAALAPAGER